jgi:hypothetical protein
MTSDADICSYCRHFPVSQDDRNSQLCQDCLDEHKKSWHLMDKLELSQGQ